MATDFDEAAQANAAKVTSDAGSTSTIITYKFQHQPPPPPVRQPSTTAQIFSAIAAWLALSSIIVAGGGYYFLFLQNEARDRTTHEQNITRDQIAAAARICEKFASDPLIVKLVEDIRGPLLGLDQKGNIELKPPAPSSIDPAPLKQDAYKYKLRQWLQILDAIAVGLNKHVYHEDVMKACMGPVFVSATGIVSDKPDHFFNEKEYPEILWWADKFK